MEKQFERTALLIGKDGVENLKKSKVIIYGIGGVGSYAVESIVRAGVENITLVDNDIIDITNLNRQLQTNRENVGMKKVDVMKERILSINPNAIVTVYMPATDEHEEMYIDSSFDYVIDAIDTMKTKIKIIERANEVGVPIITCTGAANRLDPTMLEVADIYSTTICPVARILRKELKSRGIKSLKVVYSKEEVKKTKEQIINPETKKVTLGSVSFVPSVAGLIMGGEVIKDIIKKG